MPGINLDGARVLLTGASSGIGRATAKRLAARGAVLAVAARRRDLLYSLADEIAATGRPRPVVFTADLSQRGAAHALATKALHALGVVDVLVNNAGGGVGGSQWAVGDGDEGREALEVNHWSPLALIHDLVPAMRERGHGAVVNVTSGAQVTAWPGFGAYAATKAAFALATRTLDMELHGSGVHVIEVIPGPVDTAVQGETRLLPGIERMLDRGPLGDPDVLAARIVGALERGRRCVIYPGPMRVVFTLPGLARWYTRRVAARTWSNVDSTQREELLGTVVRSGSMGDPIAREAREAWERAHART
jgi:short-subunit dehydrogenase